MCHFPPDSPLNVPCSFTITCPILRWILVSSQKLFIPVIEINNIYSPLTPQHKYISTAAAISAIFSCLISPHVPILYLKFFEAQLLSMPIIQKPCLLIIPILNFSPHINATNHIPLVGQLANANLISSFSKMVF